ncbi:hypothetical protein L218DRAFT_958242 [Marasmius fiardii PR-910]|nr:hypothetical protein L218DRAFT_958242 [Marasmius fiardii PR-910]
MGGKCSYVLDVFGRSSVFTQFISYSSFVWLAEALLFTTAFNPEDPQAKPFSEGGKPVASLTIFTLSSVNVGYFRHN